MKYTAALVALAAAVSAQTLADIPGCALPCLQKAVAADTSCSDTDVACICKSFDEIQGDATGCIVSACGSSVAINKVLPAAQALCANPPSGGSGGGATTSKASEPTTTAAAQSSGYQQGGSSTSVAVSTVYSVSSMSAPASSGYAQPTGGNGGNGTNPPPPTTSSFPGAAPVAGSIGGLAMLALGALAL